MNTTIIVAALVAGGPATNLSDAPPSLALDHITVNGPELIAFDPDENVVATVVVMRAPDGGAIFAADFDDGYVEVVSDPSGGFEVKTDMSSELIEARMSALDEALDISSGRLDQQVGKFTCVAGAVGSVLVCAKLSLWCPVAILATMCTCAEAFDQPVSCP